MTGDGTSERGSQPPRTLFSLGREGSKRRRGGTDVADDETKSSAPAYCSACGELLTGGAFCGDCGAPVTTSPADDADLGATDLIDEDLGLDEVPDLIDEDLELDEDVDAPEPVEEVATADAAVDDEAAVHEKDGAAAAPVPAARPRGRKAKKRGKRARAGKAKAAAAGGAAPAVGAEVADTGAATVEAEAVEVEAEAVEAESSEIAESSDVEAAEIEAVEDEETELETADDETEVVERSEVTDASDSNEPADATPLAVLAAGATAKADAQTADAAEPDGKATKRSPVGWIVAGVAAAIIVIAGIVVLATRGGDEADDVASGSDTVTARRESTTTSSSSSTTTSTQPTTTSTAAETTTTEAPTSTQAPVTTVVNVGPQPQGPKGPAALRIAGITCPLGSNPCTISPGGTLTVTLVNDGASAGSYSVGGPGLQGPNGALSGESSVSVTVRDTVGTSDRLAPLTINGAGGLNQTVNVLVK